MAVLDKGVYQLFIDGKQLKVTINGNLLQPYYDKSTWELIILVEPQKV